jgi:hypothetical protein
VEAQQPHPLKVVEVMAIRDKLLDLLILEVGAVVVVSEVLLDKPEEAEL